MFERYTERARRVIFFARYEASIFGSPYIESEFLLLGILREDKHVIVRWLGKGDWETILREEVEKRVHKGLRTSTSVDLPLSEDAKRVLAYAAEEAEGLSDSHIGHIGTEHLFLGLLREPESRVAKMLSDQGVNTSAVREALAKEGARSGIGVGTVSSGVATKHFFEMVIVSEEGSPLLHPSSWRSRVPAVGEVLSVNRGQGESTVYQVVKVEWKVVSIPPESPYLDKALIHVRKLTESVSGTPQ